MRPGIVDTFRNYPPNNTFTVKIDDKVRCVSGSFDFRGTVLCEFVTSKGRRMYVVEQEYTAFVQTFGGEALQLIAEEPVKLEVKHLDPDVEWFNALPAAVALEARYVPPPPPPPPPPPEFPITLWVPVKAVPGQSNARNRFRTDVRLNWLPTRPFVSLITCDVKVAIEFHFLSNEVGDIDNLTKPVLDLLKGSVIYDDKQVKELSAKYVPNGQNGFKVTITKYAA